MAHLFLLPVVHYLCAMAITPLVTNRRGARFDAPRVMQIVVRLASLGQEYPVERHSFLFFGREDYGTIHYPVVDNVLSCK
jgi:hypothetical protein